MEGVKYLIPSLIRMMEEPMYGDNDPYYTPDEIAEAEAEDEEFKEFQEANGQEFE